MPNVYFNDEELSTIISMCLEELDKAEYASEEYIEQTKEYRETIRKVMKKSRKNIYLKEKRIKDDEMIEEAMKIAHEMQGMEYGGV